MNEQVYEIEYYEEDKLRHWTNTMKDMVLAKSEEEAVKKFVNKHSSATVFSIVNNIIIDY